LAGTKVEMGKAMKDLDKLDVSAKSELKESLKPYTGRNPRASNNFSEGANRLLDRFVEADEKRAGILASDVSSLGAKMKRPEAIAKAGDVVPVLGELLDLKNATLNKEVFDVLQKMESSAKAALPKLEDILKDTKSEFRAQAAKTIVEIGPRAIALPAFRDVLIKTQDTQDKVYDELRTSAAEAIGKIRPTTKAAVLALKDRAQFDGATNVRYAAIEALGRIGPEAAVPDVLPFLIAMVKDKGKEDDGIRTGTIRALGEMGPAAASAVPALTNIVNDKDEGADEENQYVKEAAAEALEKIGGAPKKSAAVQVEEKLIAALKPPKEDEHETKRLKVIEDIKAKVESGELNGEAQTHILHVLDKERAKLIALMAKPLVEQDEYTQEQNKHLKPERDKLLKDMEGLSTDLMKATSPLKKTTSTKGH